MGNEMNLTVKNDQAELDRIVGFVENASERLGFGLKEAGEINLMLEELFINSVSYGYPDGRAGEIEIILELKDDTIKLEYSDDGEEFDPLQIKEADTGLDIERRGVGGLGMHLIRRLSDGIEYERRGGRNVLTVFKKNA